MALKRRDRPANAKARNSPAATLRMPASNTDSASDEPCVCRAEKRPYPLWKLAKKKNAITNRRMPIKMRQGIAPWRGTTEAFGFEDFFLIFGLATYFLNKLSKAARASVAFRGAETTPFDGACDTTPAGATSRATVTR